jgi:hypothetical protein
MCAPKSAARCTSPEALPLFIRERPDRAPAILSGALHRFIAWIDLPHWVMDGPILSQARSRSKGPLSDQVADAPNSRGQCRSWVASRDSMAIPRTAGIGASRSLSVCIWNGSSCPIPVIARRHPDRLRWGGYLPLAPGVSTVRYPIPERIFDYVSTVRSATAGTCQRRTSCIAALARQFISYGLWCALAAVAPPQSEPGLARSP